MNLYDISSNLAFLIEKGLAEELTEEDQAELDSLKVDRSVKLENYGKVIRTLEATAKAYKEEEQRLRAKRETAEKNIAWLKHSVLSDLERHNQKRITAGVFDFTRVQYAPKLKIVNEDQIPNEFLTSQVVERIDKQLINSHFSATGEILPGTTLSSTESLRIK